MTDVYGMPIVREQSSERPGLLQSTDGARDVQGQKDEDESGGVPVAAGPRGESGCNDAPIVIEWNKVGTEPSVSAAASVSPSAKASAAGSTASVEDLSGNPSSSSQGHHFCSLKVDDALPLLPAVSPSSQQPTGLFKRLTTKLRPPSALTPAPPQNNPTISPPTSFPALSSRSRSRSRSRTRAPDPLASAPQPPVPGPKRKPTLRLPGPPPPSALPTSFTSRAHRHAALVARGLVPAAPAPGRFRDAQGYMMPLSEQEKELDRRYAVLVDERRSNAAAAGSDGGHGREGEQEASEARRIKEAWLARNRDRESASPAHEDENTQAKTKTTSNTQKTDSEKIDGGDGGPPVPSKDPVSSKQRRHSNAAAVANVDAPLLQARRASDVSERVARWLHASVSRRAGSVPVPAPTPASSADDSHAHAHAQRAGVLSPSNAPVSDEHEPSGRRSSVSSHVQSRPQTPNDHASSPTTAPRTSPRRKPAPPSSYCLKGKATGTGTGKNESPDSVLITISPGSSSSHSHSRSGSGSSAPAIPAPAIAVSHEPPRLSLETNSEHGHGHDPHSLRPYGSRGRGSPGSGFEQPHGGSQELSTTPESGSSLESQRRPALSPTRTMDSSTQSESLLPATPTTFSHGCEIQSPSQSKGRPRRATGHGPELRIHTGTDMNKLKDLSGGIVESPVQDDAASTSESQSFVNVEFGRNAKTKMEGEARRMAELMAAAAATPRARPRGRGHSQDSERRKSLNVGLGIFGRKSASDDDPPPFKNPRTSTSMQNLRRNLTQTLTSLRTSRPKTTIDTAPSAPAGITSFDALSPSSPPSAFPPSSFPSALRSNTSRDPSPAAGAGTTPRKSTVGVGLRPRQALSPTMHDRGSILVEAGRIADEESRRLSEMAFLYY